MGQKAHPKGLRLGIIENWESSWFAQKGEYKKALEEDLRIRSYLKNNLYKAGISKIRIHRKANQVEVDIYTAKPGYGCFFF